MLLGLRVRRLLLRVDRPWLRCSIASHVAGIGASACRTDVGVGHHANRLTAQKSAREYLLSLVRLNNVFVTNAFFFFFSFSSSVLERERERQTLHSDWLDINPKSFFFPASDFKSRRTRTDVGVCEWKKKSKTEGRVNVSLSLSRSINAKSCQPSLPQVLA